jgi:hypothetical protein
MDPSAHSVDGEESDDAEHKDALILEEGEAVMRSVLQAIAVSVCAAILVFLMLPRS